MKRILLPVLAAVACCGCLAIKTEHEVKPIKISMDVNLKVDKALESAIESEQRKPPARFAEIRSMLQAGKIGFGRGGALEPRLELTQEEADALEEAAAARTTRLSEIAKETGSTLSDVRRSHGEKMLARMPAGTWYRDEAGAWTQKK
ncbi:MAG: DUF1318 domain-containing protein [Kiritimatiellae bacterium]|nr:DUF1318 domain-containing protein [Kiritimatiellia bacterium]